MKKNNKSPESNKNEKYDQRFSISVSKKQLALINQQCKALSISKSEVVRLALDKRKLATHINVIDPENQKRMLVMLTDMINELNQQERYYSGAFNNLNQIAKKLNSNQSFTNLEKYKVGKVIVKINDSIISLNNSFKIFDQKLSKMWDDLITGEEHHGKN